MVGIFLGLIMIAALLIPPVITRFDREVREQRSTRVAYGVASWALWIALLVGALSVPDEADGGALDTALTTWTGAAIDDASSRVVFAVAGVAMLVAYPGQLALAIVVGGAIIAARSPWSRRTSPMRTASTGCSASWATCSSVSAGSSWAPP